MRKSSHACFLVRDGGAPVKTSGYRAHDARPRSTASETYTSWPARRKNICHPGRPSGVVSQVTPVRPPPCQSSSGYFARGWASLTYCTYICSTSKSPFRSTVIGGAPAVRTTSRVGSPVSDAERPPMWKLPTSETDSGSPAPTRPSTRAVTLIADAAMRMCSSSSAIQLVPARQPPSGWRSYQLNANRMAPAPLDSRRPREVGDATARGGWRDVLAPRRDDALPLHDRRAELRPERIHGHASRSRHRAGTRDPIPARSELVERREHVKGFARHPAIVPRGPPRGLRRCDGAAEHELSVARPRQLIREPRDLLG